MDIDLLRQALWQDPATGLIVLGKARDVLSANLACAVLCKNDALAGQPVTALFHPDDGAALEAVLTEVERSGKAAIIPRLRLCQEPVHWVAATALAISPGADVAPRLVLRIVDISHQIALEAELDQLRAMQAPSLQVKALVHDFNNFLTVIHGAAEEILERRPLDPAIADAATDIGLSAARGAALVRQMIDGGRNLSPSVPLLQSNGAIRDLAPMLRRLAGGAIDLRLVLDPAEAWVAMDAAQFDRVLVNLVVNASHAMPQGGSLTLETAREVVQTPQRDAGGAEIRPGCYVMIALSDTGSGIPAGILPRIFDPGFTTRSSEGGSGLGLAMVHTILRQSGGRVVVDSVPGRGTRFCLYLPDCSAPAQAVVPAERDMPVPTDRLILLVEDEASLRGFATRALTRDGWDVLAVETAEMALAQIADMAVVRAGPRPAAIIADMQLDGLNGAELVARVRQVWPGLPAILVSGYALPCSDASLRTPGIGFLPKPYTSKALLSALKSGIARAPG